MKRILITGMSGVGKSAVIARLAAQGHKAIDTDYGDYFEPVEPDEATRARFGDAKDWRWREDRITALLDTEDADALFLSGTCSNQSTFYARFDHIVLLSLPEPVARERLATRTSNRYGKDPAELARELALRPIVEPLLRRAATVEIDAAAPLDDVVARVVALAGTGATRRR